MNILFLNEYAHPNIISGAERSMIALSKALNKKTKVFTLSPNLQPSRTDLEGDQMKFPFPKKIKPGRSLSPLWFNNLLFWIYASFWIIKIIKVKKINLIHVHGKYIQPSAIIAKWLTNTPVITTVRDFKFLCPLALCYTHQQKKCTYWHYLIKEIPEYLNKYSNNSILKPFITLRLILAKLNQNNLKWFLNQSDQVIAVSPQLADIHKLAGIKNPISIYNLPPKTNTIKSESNKQPIILSIGKLSYGKGTEVIFQTAKILEKKLSQVKFIFAGLKNISLKKTFPKNCQYLGKLSHKQVLKLYQKANIFIILSRWPEPLSRAGLEALSFGLPIIASNRGGNQEMIKDNGYLVDLNSPKRIANKLYKILTSQKLQKQFSKNSLKLLKTRFNRNKIIKLHFNLYQKLTI